jgi:hypothetical protein
MSEPDDRTPVPTSDVTQFVGPTGAPDRFELLAERSGAPRVGCTKRGSASPMPVFFSSP